jgi:hypothetical protein
VTARPLQISPERLELLVGRAASNEFELAEYEFAMLLQPSSA